LCNQMQSMFQVMKGMCILVKKTRVGIIEKNKMLAEHEQWLKETGVLIELLPD